MTVDDQLSPDNACRSQFVARWQSDVEHGEFIRWWRELLEQREREEPYALKPLIQAQAIRDSWLQGKMVLHLDVGLRPDFLRVDATQFCIDLQQSCSPLDGDPYVGAVGVIGDFVVSGEREQPQWLERPVLVIAGEVVKDSEAMKRPLSRSYLVGLEASNNCYICAPHSGQHVAQAIIERCTPVRYREVDSTMLLLRQARRGALTSSDQSPSEMIQATPEVVSDIPKNQCPRWGERGDVGDDQWEPVTLRVVIHPKRIEWLSLSIVCKALDISMQRLAMTYRPAPLEPSAVEKCSVWQDRLSSGRAVGAG